MKRLNFLFIAATFVACVMSSCVKEGFSERVLQNADGTCSVKLAVDMAAPVGDEVSVKSAMLPEGESLRKVTNLNYYVFDSAGNFISQTFYDGDLRNFHVDLPDYDGTYKVFFFANVGEFQIPENTKAEDMATACHYDYSTYSNYVSKIKSLGFPAALAVLEFNAKTAASISIIPLVYTLKVKINTDALSDFNNLTIKQIRVRQAARDIFPFSSASKLTQKFRENINEEAYDGCDYLSVSDISKLTSKDNSVNLYMLENMRGELIPGNESWKNKVPASISEEIKTERDKSTYIEISAEVTTATAEYDNVIYRAYLGKSASNFDVQRNTVFTLTNNFTDDMVTAEDWRIEPGTPTVTGTLEFVLPKNTESWKALIEEQASLDGEEYVNSLEHMIPSDDAAGNRFFLTDGFKRVFYIKRSNKDISYTITTSKPSTQKPYLTYSIQRYNDTYDRIIIWSEQKEDASQFSTSFASSSNKFVNGIRLNVGDPENIYPVDLNIESSDGLISTSIKCVYFYNNFPVWLSTSEPDGALSLMMNNPLDLYVRTQTALGMEGVIPGLNEGYASGYRMKDEDWYSAVPGQHCFNTNITMPYFEPGRMSASTKILLVFSAVEAIGVGIAVAASFTNPITGGLAVPLAGAVAGTAYATLLAIGTSAFINTLGTAVVTNWDEDFGTLSSSDYRPYQIVKVPMIRTYSGVPSYNLQNTQKIDSGASGSLYSNYFSKDPSLLYNVGSLSRAYEILKNRMEIKNKYNGKKIHPVPFALEIHNTVIPGHWKGTESVYINGDTTYEVYAADSADNGVYKKIITESSKSFGLEILSKQKGLIANTDGWRYKTTAETYNSDEANTAYLMQVWDSFKNRFVDGIKDNLVGARNTKQLYAKDFNGNKWYLTDKDYREDGSWTSSGAFGYALQRDLIAQIGSYYLYDSGDEREFEEGAGVLDTERFRFLLGIGNTPNSPILGLMKKSADLDEWNIANTNETIVRNSFVAKPNEQVKAAHNPYVIYWNSTEHKYKYIRMNTLLGSEYSRETGLSGRVLTSDCNVMIAARNLLF